MNNLDYLKNKKILLVDDEEGLLDLLQTILYEDGYSNIKKAKTMDEALNAFYEFEPDGIILDIMLPDGDGFQLLSNIRKSSDIPVLFLSAKDAMDDQYHGFSLGADDYLTKPFLPKDLILRLQAVLRRAYREEAEIINLKYAAIRFDRGEIIRDDESFALTAKEFSILQTLYQNANRIVTIDGLCQSVWGDAYYGYENSLMTHIRRIREKIEKNPSYPESLITIKGLGYKFIVEGR
ncbi:MAG: response regulator transcription factor [Tissierella sp.]|nr:response regulator transcription factor [Tissierella sp.]